MASIGKVMMSVERLSFELKSLHYVKDADVYLLNC